MPNKYTPAKKTIGELLSMTNPPILVPEWQRNFSWTTSEAETFWQDLSHFDNSYPGDNILDQEYFLGSIVIVDDNVSHLLLDGQQRLATSAILISVMRDYLARYNRDAATRVSTRYLTDFDDAQNRNTFKLTLNRYDRDFFRREILENRDAAYVEMAPTLESHRLIRRTRTFFAEKFEEKYLEMANPEASHQWALRLLQVLIGHVSTVAVISEDEDNAAAVFETLNDRGIGLSTPDLLRNQLLRRARHDTREEVIDLWREILEIEGDTTLKTFLRHFWLSREGDVKTQSLYKEIKAKIVDENIDSLAISRQLRDSSLIYRDIVAGQDDNDEDLSSMLSDIAELGATVLYPAVLSGYETGDTEDVKDLVKALISAFVRHNTIGGLENSKLESVIYTLAMNLRNTDDFAAAIEQLRGASPNDERFFADFMVASVSRRASARYLLKNIEHAMRATRELDVAPPSRVHVEHIYPQTPRAGERWANHAAVINRLGNLTLLARKLNAAIRNSNFPTKLPAYQRSDLLLTQDLLNDNNWNELSVNVRQVRMSQFAREIWSFPGRQEAVDPNGN